MKRWLILIGTLFLSAGLVHAEDPGRDQVDQSRIIVKYRQGAAASAMSLQSAGSARRLGIGHNSERAHRFSTIMEDFVVVKVPKGMSVADAMALYQRDPRVEFVTPNRLVHAYLTPNDSSFASAQWNFHNTGQTINGHVGTPGADVHGPEAWDIETGTSRTIIVAVLDSGVDYTHPDLAANMWTNPNEIAGNGVDDDGDGIIDDVHGANFVGTGTPTGDPMDDYFHGTHVAGIIGAVTNNSAGVAGTAWNVKIMALKFLDSTGTGSIADAVEGIQYAVAHGANVINNSWGTFTNDPTLASAVTAAKAAGVVLVAAAGNDANSSVKNYPAAYPEVIAVSATNNKDQVQTLSFGPHVALGAPGVDILSTTIGGGYITASGTSMASPHVAGAAGLLLAHSSSLTPDQVRSLLVNSVDTPSGWNFNYGDGRLNIFKALGSIGDVTPPTVAISTPTDGSTVNGVIQVSANASDNVTVLKVQFFIDGVMVATMTGTSPYSGNYNTALLSDGSHTIMAKAFDGAGNTATNSVTINVANSDTTPPTVSIDTPTAGSTLAGLVPMKVTAADNVAVAKVWFMADGVVFSTKTTSPYTETLNTTRVPDGPHTLTARAFDFSGNSSSVTISVIVSNADNTPPTVSLTAPANNATVSGQVTVSANASDNIGVASLAFVLDGKIVTTLSAAPYTTNLDSTQIANGAHTLSAVAADFKGNIASDTIHITVNNIDTTPPTVHITAPTEGATVSGNATLTATATDNLTVIKVEFFLDGVLVLTDTTSPYTTTFNVLLYPEGKHTIIARAVDGAGNASTDTVHVTFSHTPTDFQAPQVSITSPAPNAHVSGAIAVTANATDDTSVSKVELYVDGTLIGSDATAPYSIDWNGDSVPSGNHVLLVKAYDPSDNVGSAQITVYTGGAAGALGLFQPLFDPARGETVSVPLMTAQVQHVKATIIDRLGAEVVTVADSDMAPGSTITWDGRNSSHTTVASGVYLMILDVDGKIETRKIIVRK